MRNCNLQAYFKEEKEIAEYLAATGKAENERLNILEECWKDENARLRWLSAARNNNPADDSNGKAAASHSNGQQQMRDAITAIEKNLITRAQIEVHDAIKHGNVDPVIAAKDAVSNAIEKAVEELGVAARAKS